MAEPVEHTLTLGEIAFDQIRRRNFAAVPKNYEVWYTFASGTNGALNQTINEAVAKSGFLTQDELDQIYEVHLSPLRMTDKLDLVGNKLVAEVDDLLGAVNRLSDGTSQYSKTLSGAQAALNSANNAETIRQIVERLASSTRAAEQNNQALQDKLSSARNEINLLQSNLEQVRAESLMDPLTTLSNRKHYDSCITREVRNAIANKQPLSLLITDIDHFKRFNDNFGHLTGDQVLRLVALAVKNNVKGQDIACRYGGEEFVVILPDTSLRSATTVADHVRRAVMSKELIKRSTGENLGRITISVGVAEFRPGDTHQSFYDRADKCLYMAKRNGRNMVVNETDLESSTKEIAGRQVA